MNDEQQLLFTEVFGNRILFSEPLATYTTFKIGGPADIFFEAKTSEELVKIIRIAQKNNINYTILGGGTNVLIGDKGVRGLVIKNSSSNILLRGLTGASVHGIQAKTVFVEADSGVMMNRLVRYTLDEGLAGFEMHLGLPGSVGGAIFMNSKWMHPEGYVGDAVYQAELLTPDGDLRIVDRDYFQFGYDTSSLQKTKDVVTKITFALHADSKERLWEIANGSISYRRTSQPQGIRSAGCSFQNIMGEKKISAGYLIDEAGLKGLKIGGAEISAVHANFISNTGGASAADVLQLIQKAKAAVKAKFGFDLTEEIEYLGEF